MFRLGTQDNWVVLLHSPEDRSVLILQGWNDHFYVNIHDVDALVSLSRLMPLNEVNAGLESSKEEISR